MRMIHNYDKYGNTESSIIYLAKPGKRLYCALGGIEASSVSVKLRTNNTAELTFIVDKYVDGEESSGYEDIDEMMELYCDGIWYKIMDPPEETNDGMQCTKSITAESYEISLTQYKLKNFKINMGEEDSYEMMYQKNHDTSKFYQIKFYNPDNEDLSFLHLVLKHGDVPGWKIGYVDNVTLDDDGILLPNEICNFDVDDQNVYSLLTQEAAPAYKCVFEFDTVNMTINVYKPDSLGKDTNVVLGFRNIQDSVTISRDDSLVTQFYVDGLDDYNIDLANFGDSVITDLSHFCCEPYMNAILQEKYTAWQDYRESRRDEYCDLSREYNKNLDVLSELTNRVPVDTAQANWFGQKVDYLKDAYDSNMAIIKGLESIHVDEEKNFDLEDLKNSSDWPLYESIMNYTLPAIVAALQAQDETVDGFGKGNIISCVNPVVLGQDWYMVGSDTSSFKTVQINDSPAYGITRGVQVTGTDGGIYQHNISIEPSQRYTLSCFVKGSGTFYLGYNNTGEDRKNISYGITSSWTRVYTSFNLSSHLIDVAFTGTSDFTICGMQLEMGDAPTQFGYFTQSESIMKAYETDWKLYGIAELKTKIAMYDACIKELKKNGYADGYNPLSGYEEAYFTQMHQKYLDYLNLKEQAEAALVERQAEYDAAKKPEIQEKRNQIAKDVLMENFGKMQEKYPAFTDKETYIIKSLYNQATYSNENIIITTLDSTVDAVDKAITLYKDAVEELYVESHPQYTYTDEIGNIYALPEFREYHDQLAVNDFVRLGLSDTRYVKLRVVEIRYNPCDMDETMEVTFSNMVQYKSKLTNDNEFLTNALNQTSNRNGGRVNSVNKSTTSDYVITSDAIKQIFSNPLFNSMLGGTTTGGTGSGGTITADMIVAELVKAKEGVFDKLTVDTAFMKYLDVKLVSADTITTRILNAEQANIEKLSAKIIESNQISADMANIKNLVSGKAGIGELQAIHLTAQNVTIDQAVVTDLIAKKIAVGDLMAQNALANQIVLISKNNKPTIAFQESTQQFYDSTGNVRVQIGMDGNGDFNFIVKNGDKAALFDENGITQTGIPDNTIINDMIDNATITKDKLGFQVIEPNEQGGIDITNIYDGKGNQWWGIEKISITNDYTTQIKNVTDTLTGEIEQKVGNTQYLKDQEAIKTEFSEVKQNVSGITSTVSSMRTDLAEAQEKITANSSSITQNADSISFMVTGTRESGFKLTPDFISMVSDNISIQAENVKIDSIIEAMNSSIDSSTTRINGGIIDTSTVNAMLIAAQTLRSKNFKDTSVTDGIYAQEGLEINMETGAMKAKNFAIDDSGNAYFKGNGEFSGKITAFSGHIGGTNGFVIESGKLYSGMETFDSDSAGVYLGTDGIALGGGKFTVDKNGNITATSGTFSGTIESTTGHIGGWTISSNSLTGRDGWVSINPDQLKYGNNFNVDSDGNLTATNATVSGEVNATTGTFNNGTFNNVDIESGQIGGLSIASGTISGENLSITSDGRINATNASISGAITATSLTLGSGVTIGVSKVSGLADVATSGDYNDLENKPDIPSDMEFYIKKDGTVGFEPSEGATGFKVSSDGLLQASNAIIYGEIVASSGKIGGFNISTKADNNDHAYKNTLYRIINGNDGYDYQAGIKGDSDSNTTIEAAFYVRKKLRNEKWGDSTIPFFVRNDGYVYCEDMTIGNSLYATGELSTKYDNLTSKFKIITAATDGVYFGLLNDTIQSRLACHTKGMLYELGVDRPFTIAKDGNLTYSIKKQGSINVDLGASGVNYRYRNLYIEKIIFPDDSSMTTAKTSGDASSYGSLTNKPGINGHTLASGNNTLSDLGIAARSHFHSSSDINWSTTLGYKGFGHCHTVIMNSNHNMWIAINNDGIPALTPYKLSSKYTNVDEYTITKGGTCNLGSTSAPWNAVYAKNYYDANGNPISGSGSSGRGIASITSDGTSANGLKITFNSNCQTESTTYDWVQIFYESNGRKIALSKLGGSFGGTTVSIPSTTFWLYWRTDSSSDSFYGFSIDSITPANVSSPSLSTTSDSFPSYSVTELSGSNYPESSHGNYGDNINQLWRYTYSGEGTGSYKITLEDGTVYTLNTGSSTQSPSPTVNQATSYTAGIMKLYDSTGSNTDGTMTQAAIKAAIDAIDTSGGGGGNSYYAGNGLYLSGSTFNIGYNSRYSANFYEGSNSNHYAFCPTLANNAGDEYRLYLGGNGGSTHPWYKVVTRDGMQQLSDGRFKIDKCILNDDFYDMYMSLKPTKYKVLHDEDSGIHFGFVAQEVEESLKTVGLDASNCSIVSCDESQSYEGGYVYGLSYNEFIPFNTYMTQKAHHRIDSLESENQSLKNEILMLQGQLSLITQRLQKMEEKLC